MRIAMTRSSCHPSAAGLAISTAIFMFLLPLCAVSKPGLACGSLDCGVGYCVQDEAGGHRCVCLGGYAGDNCDKPAISRKSRETSPCDSTPCGNGGTCTAMLDCGEGENCDYICTCAQGFTGQQCSQTLPSCPRNVSAGIVWEDTTAGGSLIKPCQLVDAALRGANIIRHCSLEGEWGELDYTECTIDSGSSPFLLLWVVAEATSRDEIDNTVVQLGNTVFLALNISTANRAEISFSQMLTLDESESLYRSFLTYKIQFNRKYTVDEMLSSLNIDLPAIVIFNQTSVILEGQGYKGFFPSDVCNCLETNSSLVTLCTVVNGNDHSSACTCSIQQSECQCVKPFYVGNGVECAVDQDGDGYPNTALQSCTPSDTESYCSEDICPLTYYQLNSAFPCATEDLDPNEFDGCIGGEDIWGFIWASVRNGEGAVVLCPDGQGTATRSCVNGVWELAQVLDCHTSGFTSVLTEVEEVFRDDDKDLLARLDRTASIMLELLQVIQPRNNLSHLPGDINSANVILSGVLTLLEDTMSPDNNITDIPNQSVFKVFNSALNPNNAQGWMTLQDNKGGAGKMLDSVERYGLYRSLVAEDKESRAIHQDENIVLGIIRHSSAADTSPVKFPESLNDLENTIYSNAITAQISIPPELLSEKKSPGAMTAPIAGSIARGMELVLMPKAESTGVTRMVASQVISAQVAERKIEDAVQFQCAYWKFSDPVGSGEWAFDGVEMVSMTSSNGSTVITCKSKHLSSFAVLVDVSGGVSEISQTELQALMAVSYIGCALSLACLFLAILYYISLRRELFIHVHYFVHFNLAISLFLAYLVFVLGIQLARENEGACIFVAALLQYFFLSAFCWMMCEGVMLYLMLVLVFSKVAKQWWFFLLLGWLPPLVPVVIGLAARHSDYGVENNNGDLEYCWLSTDKGVIWAFVAPMLVIITINVFFLVIALVKVFQSKRRQAHMASSTAAANFSLFKSLFRATVVLLPMLGLTWVFGLFAVNRNAIWLAWLFTIFNSLQGVFIFIFHVIMSDKFWKSARVKRLRRKATSSLKSSRFGSTVTSTIRKPTTRERGSQVSKYLAASTDSKMKLVDANFAPDSSTELTKVEGNSVQQEIESSTTVLTNTEDRDISLSTAASAKSAEITEDSTVEPTVTTVDVKSEN